MKTQKGFTLIELMIGMTIAMIVLSGVGTLFVKTLTANTRNVTVQKFDQTLRTLSDTMSSEIRRANYANVGVVLEESLVIGDSGKCITFSHSIPQTSTNAAVDKSYYGYRVSSGIVYIRKNDKAVTCTTSVPAITAVTTKDTNWLPITDSRVMQVTSLTFSGTSVITINITAAIVGTTDSSGTGVTRTLPASTVKVRNT